MEYGGHRDVAMRSLIAPGDLKARTKQLHVVELAASTARLGGRPMNDIVARKVRAGWEIIAGRDRFAANTINGVKKTSIHVVLEATPQEVHDLEVEENLRRRVDDHDAMVAESVRKVAARIRAERAASSDTNIAKPGRPKSPEGEAGERIAARLGVQPGAVKEAVRRFDKREEGPAGNRASATTASPVPPIELFGNAMPDGVAFNVGTILFGLREVETALRAARAAVKKLGLTTTARPDDVGRLAQDVEVATASLKAITPTHLCPYCKGLSGAIDAKGLKCTACHDDGFVTRAVFMSAPPEKRNGWTDDEQAAGLDAMPAATPGEAMARARSNPPVKAGVTYVADGEGGYAEQVAAKPAKPKRGVRISVNGSAPMSPEEAVEFCDAQASES